MPGERQPSRGVSSGSSSGLKMPGLESVIFWGLAGLGTWLVYRAIRSMQTPSLRDKVVLITGGSRGLGLVLARELAQEGAHLAICARDQAELDRAREELTSRGARVIARPCDVTDQTQVNEFVNSVLSEWGRIDALINNAGTIAVGPQETMTNEDFEKAMRTNFWGPLYMIQAVLPSMRERQEGRIVNVSSIGGKVSVPHMLPYSASKFALVGLSEGLRAELGKDGILVTTVCPGLMTTGSPRNANFKGRHEAEYAWFSISDAMPGVAMRAEDAARQIITACKQGDAEVVLSLPAKLAVLFHDLFPGIAADILGLINRALLPAPGGVGQAAVKGKESESELIPDWLSQMNDQAARANNEMTPEEAQQPWRPRNRIFKDRQGDRD